MKNSLDLFFNPLGIAILGATNDPSKLGFAVTRNLVESGYNGIVHLVNPKGGLLFNHMIHTSISQVPDPVDLAVIIVPASSAPQALREIGQRGIKAAILTSGGFRETGLLGAELEDEVVRVCKEFGIRLIGPNCVGILDTHLPFDTTFLPQPMPTRGDIAFLSHSGAFCAAVIDWSRGQGFGFSKLVSLGNQADLTETDLLPTIASDPHTKTICLYLESITDGQNFLKTSQQISVLKPIIALKVGHTAAGQRAAASHTGAMAGSESALNAAFEKAGVMRAATAEQLFDWARALSACPLPVGKNIAILTSAGGPGVIASDAVETEGMTLAAFRAETEAKLIKLLPSAASTHNPVDMLASAGPLQYTECLSVLLADPDVDGVMVITLPPPSHLAEDIADALIPLIQTSPKPVLVAQMGSHLTAVAHQHFVQSGIPVYPFPERAASALGILYKRAEFLKHPQNDKITRSFEAITIPGLSADELVAAYGIVTAPLRLATSPEGAARLSSEMSFPLVAKIASPDISHKSDIGGVLLDLTNAQELSDGYTTLMMRAKMACPDALLEGITIQRQIAAGQDIIIGAIRDPQFGVLMMFGSGGVEAEGLKDVSFSLAPLSRNDAEKMIQSTWAGKKLSGFRSIASVDKESIVDAIIKLSWLAIDHPEFSEIEINPLRALTQGCIALDIRTKQS